jgi:hypothetical protein
MDTAPLVLSKKGHYGFDEKALNSAISKANAIGGVVGQAVAGKLASLIMPDSVQKMVSKQETQQLDMFAEKTEPQSSDNMEY